RPRNQGRLMVAVSTANIWRRPALPRNARPTGFRIQGARFKGLRAQGFAGPRWQVGTCNLHIGDSVSWFEVKHCTASPRGVSPIEANPIQSDPAEMAVQPGHSGGKLLI